MGAPKFDGRDVARKLRGKRTYTEIAELAGLQRQTVASFEDNPAKAQRETLRRLARVYEMTEQELREAVGIAGIPPDTVTAEVDTALQKTKSDPAALTRPVSDPVSTTGEGKQEGHTVDDRGAQIASLVRGLEKHEQDDAYFHMRAFVHGLGVPQHHAPPQPAAGRAPSRRRRK